MDFNEIYSKDYTLKAFASDILTRDIVTNV